MTYAGYKYQIKIRAESGCEAHCAYRGQIYPRPHHDENVLHLRQYSQHPKPRLLLALILDIVLFKLNDGVKLSAATRGSKRLTLPGMALCGKAQNGRLARYAAMFTCVPRWLLCRPALWGSGRLRP